MSYKPIVPSKENQKSVLTGVIDLLAVGIPFPYGLRELIQNGIESNNRNKQDSLSEVIITTDHREEYKNKICIINRGGDTLTEEKFDRHLLDLANSGNKLVVGSNQKHDVNKGVGAKPGVWPFHRKGVCYNSTNKDYLFDDDGADLQYGIKTTISKENKDNLYCQVQDFCEEEQEASYYPRSTDIHPLLKGQSGTSVTIYGNTDEEDTFKRYDKACSLQGSSGGSGYSIAKWIDHRYFTIDQIVKVEQKGKEDGVHKGWLYCKGMKDILQNYSYVYNNKRLYGTTDLIHKGIKIKAHWAAIYLEKDGKGYNSNKISHGFTALCFKEELYHDYHRDKGSKTSETKRTGLLIEPQRYVVIYEFPSDCDLKTDVKRTDLYYNEQEKIDIEQLHNLFSMNIPVELKEFMASLYDPSSQTSIEDFMKDQMKKLNKLNMGGSGVVKKKFETRKRGNGKNENPDPDRVIKKRKTRKKKDTGNTGNKFLRDKLKDLDPPQVIPVQESEWLVDFTTNGNNYSISIGVNHPVYLNRKKEIENEHGQVPDKISDLAIQGYLATAVLKRAVELDKYCTTKQEIQDKLQPEKLEALCNYDLGVKIVKYVSKQVEKYNAINIAA
jgi:hypothetical protein